MEKGYKEDYKKILIMIINRQATKIAIDNLKQNIKYKQPILLLFVSLVMITILSIMSSTWWLFIPIGFIYFIYDYIRKFKYVKTLLPNIILEIIDNTYSESEENLHEVKEDLKIKVDIYNDDDKYKKESEIDMLSETLKILKNYKKTINK